MTEDSYTDPRKQKERDWEVTEAGLECGHYFIEASRLGERRPGRPDILDWPVHLSEKTWINFPQFEVAFREACKRHAASIREPFDQETLERSLKIGGDRAAYRRRYEEEARKLNPVPKGGHIVSPTELLNESEQIEAKIGPMPHPDV